jgi:hypothetical protein
MAGAFMIISPDGCGRFVPASYLTRNLPDKRLIKIWEFSAGWQGACLVHQFIFHGQ